MASSKRASLTVIQSLCFAFGILAFAMSNHSTLSLTKCNRWTLASLRRRPRPRPCNRCHHISMPPSLKFNYMPRRAEDEEFLAEKSDGEWEDTWRKDFFQAGCTDHYWLQPCASNLFPKSSVNFDVAAFHSIKELVHLLESSSASFAIRGATVRDCAVRLSINLH